MNDQTCFSVGCIVRRQDQILLVRHTYGGANGKLLIPGGYCQEHELPEEAAVREVLEETGITAQVIRMLGIRCHREHWYLLLEMDYVSGTPASDHCENSEALFLTISEALTRKDCTEMTKTVLRKITGQPAAYLYPDMEYRLHKGSDYMLYL